MTRSKFSVRTGVLASLGLVAMSWALANADPRDRDHDRGPGRGPPPAHQHYDARFDHNHPYFDRGYVVHDLPRDRMIFNRGGRSFYYSAGVWYAPRGVGFAVIAPPVGLFIPVLPPYYSTVWFGGVPYYYANDTYYMWNGQNNGYEVVDTPNGAVNAAPDAAPPPPPTTNQLFIYPRNNQSADQQAKDKYECHTWANGQTGFNPTTAGGGVPPDQFGAKSTDYYRAMAACLQGRGYSTE